MINKNDLAICWKVKCSSKQISIAFIEIKGKLALFLYER